MPRSITIPAGTTRNIIFNVTYSDNWSVVAKRGAAVAVADISFAKFTLKREIEVEDDNADYVEVSPTIAEGIVTVTIAASDTKELEGRYYGTLRLILATGSIVDWEDTSYADVPYIYIDVVQGAVEEISSPSNSPSESPSVSPSASPSS